MLGASLDWSREVFTMDAQRSEAVVTAFVRMHEQGLIYRGGAPDPDSTILTTRIVMGWFADLCAYCVLRSCFADRMVNWCPHLRTVLSDIEVDYETIDGPTRLSLPGRGATGSDKVEFGVIHNFAYPLCDADADADAEGGAGGGGGGGGPREIVVGTTRLETMLGDAAVVVHPEDDRYRNLVGRHVIHPIHGHRLPIIADAELVDMEMGSGAVKITPAHDPNDFACAERHQLPVLTMMDDQGAINALGATGGGSGSSSGSGSSGAEFLGMDRFEARRLLVARLDEMGLYRGSDPHPMRLGRCSRSGDIIEPMVKPQWFVRLQAVSDTTAMAGEVGSDSGSSSDGSSASGGSGMAELADRAVAEGQIEVSPSWHRAEWHRWMEGTKANDWCVSRQLWWGHQIPAYRVVGGGGGDEQEHWVVGRDYAEAAAKATALYGQGGWESLIQDEDVLDTWFSSALFPLTALGWPHWQPQQDNTGTGGTAAAAALNMRDFYPLNVMETGSDILFFWVARMAMVCSTLEPNLYRQQQQQASSREEESNARSDDHDLPAAPFDRVLLHPVVRDKEGRKMSKSLGNVIDPLHVIHGASLETMLTDLKSGSLPEEEVQRAASALLKEYGEEGLAACGSDALRWALIGYMAQGRQIKLDVGRVVTARQFCNKIWQATRFTLRHLDAQNEQQNASLPSLLSAEELIQEWNDAGSGAAALRALSELPLGQRWLLSRLAHAAEVCGDGLTGFQLATASGAAQQFLLNELCDEYIEMTKLALAADRSGNGDSSSSSSLVGSGPEASAMLYLGLHSALRLLHPFLPFITEELYQRLLYTADQRSNLYLNLDLDLIDGASSIGGGGSSSSSSSIMSAAFPNCDQSAAGAGAGAGGGGGGLSLGSFRDEVGAEQEMSMLLAVMKAVRGLQMLQSKLLPKAAKAADGDGGGGGGGGVYEVHVNEEDSRAVELLQTHANDVAARCRLNRGGSGGEGGGGLRVVVSGGGGSDSSSSARRSEEEEEEGEAAMGWLSTAVSVGVGVGASETAGGAAAAAAPVAQQPMIVRLGIPLDDDVLAKVGQELKRLAKKSKKLTTKKAKLQKQMTSQRSARSLTRPLSLSRDLGRPFHAAPQLRCAALDWSVTFPVWPAARILTCMLCYVLLCCAVLCCAVLCYDAGRYQENTPAEVKTRDEGTVAGLDAEMDSIADTLQHLSGLGSR